MKSITSKIFQGILIVALVFSGNFVLTEEISEKSENTEQSEEALHSLQHSHVFLRSKLSAALLVKQAKIKKEFKLDQSTPRLFSISDFNLDHIYYTSYLDTFTLG